MNAHPDKPILRSLTAVTPAVANDIDAVLELTTRARPASRTPSIAPTPEDPTPTCQGGKHVPSSREIADNLKRLHEHLGENRRLYHRLWRVAPNERYQTESRTLGTGRLLMES